jgi:shikimate dehydrogenase
MRRFGLIGYPLSHSFSQKFFTEKFKKEGLTDCVYENFPIESIYDLQKILKENSDLQGLNVTIPYKQLVIRHLDSAADTLPVRACNCIKITAGKTIGYNTDVIGFEKSLMTYLQPWHKHALILGKGGATEAVQYVLEKLGIEFKIVSRKIHDGSTLTYEELTGEMIQQHQLIINCTPLGMHPNVEGCPQIPYECLTPQHYLFDLVYNPPKTLFLQKGEEHGSAIMNGHQMLIIQAEESWKIWNDLM